MSLGSIVGGIFGGIVGFFIGGPMGAIYGVGLGFGIGGMIDPMIPDVPSVGTPAPDKAVMKSTIGDPCGDLCGTTTITGHLLQFGNERAKAIYQTPESSGGKGGPPKPKPQQVGYKYYMTWQLGICRGPIQTLQAIYMNEELAWTGPLSIPVSGGKETISVEGFGSIDFYFGTSDQAVNLNVADIMEDSTLNSPLRNFCWCVCIDCKIGNYPRTPTLEFIVTKHPTVPYTPNTIIQEYDCAPMAAVYYALNTLCGLPTSWLNETNFGTSDFVLKNEFRGISVLFKDNRPALSYIQLLMNHADAILRYGNDAKFSPVLLRDDYDVDNIPVIDESSMLDEPSMTQKSWIDTINEVKVQFSEIVEVRDKVRLYSDMWVSGINGASVLCPGADYYQSEFVQCLSARGLKLWKKVHVYTQALGIDHNGTLWTWGENGQGQCGDGTQTQVNTALKPTGTEGYTWLKCGYGTYASWAIRSDNTLWVCGHQIPSTYPLPLSISPEYQTTFVQVDSTANGDGGVPTEWQDCFLGTYTSAAIDLGGNIWVWGAKTGSLTTTGFRVGDTVYTMKWNLIPRNNGAFTSIQPAERTVGNGIVAGRADGKYSVCGVNSGDKFGLGTSSPTVIDLTVIPYEWKVLRSQSHNQSLGGVTLDGDCMVCGTNDLTNNILGLGNTVSDTNGLFVTILDDCVDYSLKFYGGIALKTNGDLYHYGKYSVSFHYEMGTGLTVGETAEFMKHLESIGKVADIGDSNSAVSIIFKSQ